MSHSRDNLLPTNDWPMPTKPGHLTVVETEMTERREVCRVYVLPQRKKTKKKKGKRK
jgi:hypothetical protein